MAKVNEWSGKENSYIFLADDTNRRLIDFCNAHETVYIFGAGQVGRGFHHYLGQCDVALKGFVTSATWEGFANKYQKGKTGLVMGLNDENLAEVRPLVDGLVADEDMFIAVTEYRSKISNFSPEAVRDNFRLRIPLLPHCNFNCKSCCNFSPINRPDYYRLADLKGDLEQLRKMGLPIKTIDFTGGEPFLHPELFDIFEMTRALFPEIPIDCFTNGSLLDRLSDEQMKTLAKLDIILLVSEYPAVMDKINIFYQRADAAGAKYSRLTQESPMLFSNRKLDPEGRVPKYDFYNCFFYQTHTVNTLYKGKIWGCARAAFIDHLNDFFGTDFQISEGDFIDIYETTPDEIYRFKVTRRPFCGYHDCENGILVEYGTSERKLEEWVRAD